MDKETIIALCTNFFLPVLIIICCVILLITGIDGDVKAILAMAAGWVFKSGYQSAKKNKESK